MLKQLLIKHSQHQSSDLIARWQDWLMNFEVHASWDNAIYFDKAGFNLHTHWSVGHSPVGTRAMQCNRLVNCNRNISLLVAMSAEGIMASYVILALGHGMLLVDGGQICPAKWLEIHLSVKCNGQKIYTAQVPQWYEIFLG